MATVNIASTHWEGDLFEGSGRTTLDSSKAAEFGVRWAARAESGPGTTNPEELLAAAHATCFSMALSKGLADNGTVASSIDTEAEVSFVSGTGITGIKLTCNASVPNLENETFQELAQTTKAGCPVSQALAAVPIELEATLV